MLAKAEALARQVDDDGLPHAGHVIGQRRAQGGGQHVDRAIGKSLPRSSLHHRMAAHEIADPHIGDDEDAADRQRRQRNAPAL